MAKEPAGNKPATPKSTTKPAEPTQAAGKAAPDWERIELDYRAGIKTLRQIADENSISHGAINKRAKRDGWDRDLSKKIQSKADALVSKALVSNLVSKESKVSERQIVEANASKIADVQLAHRKDIQRKRSIVARLMDELEAQVGPENAALLADLGEMMRSPDDAGQDKLNDLYRKVISLPERAKTAKTLAENLRIAIDMERQAFGMDAKVGSNAGGEDGKPTRELTDTERAVRLLHMLKSNPSVSAGLAGGVAA